MSQGRGKHSTAFKPRVGLEAVKVEEAVAQQAARYRGVPRGWECPSGGLEHKGRSTGANVVIIGVSRGILA